MLAENLIDRPGRKATRSCGCLKRETNCQGKDWDDSARSWLFATRRSQTSRPWHLSEEQFFILIAGDCHYCRVPPAQRFYEKRRRGFCLYNGLDRVDNSEGYTLENVVSCCVVCNKAKGTMSYEDFMTYLRRVGRYRAFIDPVGQPNQAHSIP